MDLLRLHAQGGAGGAGVVGVLMLVEHSVEMSLIKRTGPLAFVGNPRTIFFTLMETLGAVGWLYFVRAGQPGLGAALLLIGLSVEHVLQGSQLKPEPVLPPVLAPTV